MPENKPRKKKRASEGGPGRKKRIVHSDEDQPFDPEGEELDIQVHFSVIKSLLYKQMRQGQVYQGALDEVNDYYKISNR